MAKLLKALAVLGAVVSLGVSQAGPVSGQGTWETTLLGRDINGNSVTASDTSAVFLYDTTLNITWLRDANLNGWHDWATASLWADALTVGRYDDWRLPAVVDTGPLGCDAGYSGTDCHWNVQTKSGDLTRYELGQTVYSEFAHLFHVTLGNLSFYDTSGVPQDNFGLKNTGWFQNLMPSAYWYGTEMGLFESTVAYSFDPVFGLQNGMFKFDSGYAVAVRDGDIACSPFPGGGHTNGCFPGPGPFPGHGHPLPEPSSLALVGLAFAGFAATRGRRTNIRANPSDATSC